MLLGSSTGLPNSVMSHLFHIPYTGSQLKKKRKRTDFKLASLCFKSLNGSAPNYPQSFFIFILLLGCSVLLQTPECSEYHPFAQVKWSVLFLLPSSNNIEQTPRFYPSRILCQFLQIFLENLFLFENVFFSAPALGCLCVSRCVFVCGCVGCVRARVHGFAVCVFELWTSKYMYVLDL